MSLLDAMDAVRRGMALSTQKQRRDQQMNRDGIPTPTPAAPPGERPFGPGGTDRPVPPSAPTTSGGDRPMPGTVQATGEDTYTQTNADGSKTVYRLVNGAAKVVGTIPAPAGAAGPRVPTWVPAPPDIPGAGPDAGYMGSADLFSPEGADALGIDYGRLAAIKALRDAGLVTQDEASDMLLGKDSGAGGGMTAAQAAAEARQQRQDEWDRVLDYITAARQERDLVAALAQQRRQNLMAAAPDLAGGMEFRGGFGPMSGYTTLNRLQGGLGAPKSMGPSLVPLDLGPVPVESNMVEELLGPLR